jgi:hypothetical protein
MICGGNRPSSKVAIFAKRRGLFSEPIIYDSYDCPEAVKVANVTGSEKDDIIVLHAGWHSVGVYSVQENGEMGEEDLYPIPYSSFNRQSMDVGDINGDGKNDVVVTHSNGLAILYHAP